MLNSHFGRKYHFVKLKKLFLTCFTATYVGGYDFV